MRCVALAMVLCACLCHLGQERDRHLCQRASGAKGGRPRKKSNLPNAKKSDGTMEATVNLLEPCWAMHSGELQCTFAAHVLDFCGLPRHTEKICKNCVDKWERRTKKEHPNAVAARRQAKKAKTAASLIRDSEGQYRIKNCSTVEQFAVCVPYHTVRQFVVKVPQIVHLYHKLSYGTAQYGNLCQTGTICAHDVCPARYGVKNCSTVEQIVVWYDRKHQRCHKLCLFTTNCAPVIFDTVPCSNSPSFSYTPACSDAGTPMVPQEDIHRGSSSSGSSSSSSSSSNSRPSSNVRSDALLSPSKTKTSNAR